MSNLTTQQRHDISRILETRMAGRHTDVVDQKLEAINQAIGGFGVEALYGSQFWDVYYKDIQYLYVNRGDTYGQTIIYDVYAIKFVVDDLGSYVETNDGLYTY